MSRSEQAVREWIEHYGEVSKETLSEFLGLDNQQIQNLIDDYYLSKEMKKEDGEEVYVD